MCSSRTVLAVVSLVLVMPLLAGSLAGGCGAVVPVGVDRDPGTLKILITDKPFPFEYIEQAIVTVTRVDVRPAVDDDAGASAGKEAEDGGFVTVLEDPAGRSFDLLTLRNGRVDVLTDTELPPGRYTQIRIVITEGEVRLRDGRVFTLRVPSGEQTGIKLRCDFTVEPGDQATLLLDVDLSRAFSPEPGGAVKHPDEIRGFRFAPSLALRIVQLDQAGSIAGTVRDANGFPIPSVAVTAFGSEGEVTSSATDEDGSFVLAGLPAGAYALELAVDGYQEARVEGVSVQPGEATDVGSVTLKAAPDAEVVAAQSLADGSLAQVNHALNAPVTLHGTFFSTRFYEGTASDPATAVDGIFLPRRTSWDRNTVWWVMVGGFINGQYLTVDLGGPRRIESFVVQTNSRESYVLSYWDLDAQAWAVAWSVPKGDVYAFGMESRPDGRDISVRYTLPSPIVTDRLKFAGSAVNGTHLYSVSEIQAFGPAPNSPPTASAGGPYEARATSWQGAVVALDGGGSHDPDGDPLQYQWRVGDEEIGNGPQLSRVFPIGVTQVSLAVSDPAGLSDTAGVPVTVAASEVSVDIKPGEQPNSINLKSKGSLPVAFLTDAGFDAASIDPNTVTFQGHAFGGFVKMTGKDKRKPLAALEDVDADGDVDLVVHLETSLLPLAGDETECTLGALTRDGFLVRGSDSVRIVPR